MFKNIQAIRGMNDHLPSETKIWQYVEEILKKIVTSYGYKEIRFPILEKTLLFKRAIGKETDIIKKEMYSFEDKKGNSFTLRPEGTSGCIRAGIEHGLLHNQIQRLWYIGPMFRHERPQRGRYRQFNQFGVEVFGLPGPNIEAELIMICTRFWRMLDITQHISLQINSIGSLETRKSYRNALITFLEKNQKKLDEDCKRRMYYNPLRVLDSKNQEIQKLLNNAPTFDTYLDDISSKHFSTLCKILKENNISYTINQRLVRGLDYYNHTVFEWITANLGAQDTVCGGGRYDTLVEELGGSPSPAVGFSIGLERLISLVQLTNLELNTTNSIIDIYLISLGKNAQLEALNLAEQVHDVLPDIKLITHYGEDNFKKQFSRAKKLGAKILLILDKEKIRDESVLIKDLRSGNQIIVEKKLVLTYLNSLFL